MFVCAGTLTALRMSVANMVKIFFCISFSCLTDKTGLQLFGRKPVSLAT